jgi:hypothetical protein
VLLVAEVELGLVEGVLAFDPDTAVVDVTTDVEVEDEEPLTNATSDGGFDGVFPLGNTATATSSSFWNFI